MTFLWESIAFGPIKSRRLGSSLGINLLPTQYKVCSFDCLYCECGWTLEKKINVEDFPPATIVLQAIEQKLKDCRSSNTHIDSITFSGNGEPTLHPQFGEIINGLLLLRKQYYPEAVITCLSNSTQLYREDVMNALTLIDNPILKLDAGSDSLLKIINQPVTSITYEEILHNLIQFKGKLIIQTLFFNGIINGIAFDNSQDKELQLWLKAIALIKPQKVMLYSLDRETPSQHLKRISKEKMEEIANKVRTLSIEATVY